MDSKRKKGMQEILLVEDAKFFRNVLKSQIENRFGYNVTAVESYGEAVNELTSQTKHFDLGLLDINLPDAPNGEIVDLVTGMDVPSIIFSGSFSEEIRDLLERPSVIDYVIKDSPASMNYVLNTVDRYFKNKNCTALVVDDSRVACKLMGNLLKQFNLNVLIAENGQEALRIFNETPDIDLVFLDFHMPDMNGVEVCKRMRAKKGRDQMCIIGVSAYGTHAISAQFLKAGASDFLVKPFLAEEFSCRVTVNLDALDKVNELDELVHTDLITGLKNRRHLEEVYKGVCDRAKSINQVLACSMFELDNFREFNDRFGSDAGDKLLQDFARLLEQKFDGSNTQIIRYGGTQFCLLHASDDPSEFFDIAQSIHNHILDKNYKINNTPVQISLTASGCKARRDHLDQVLNDAKETLTEARKTLRGQFFLAADSD